MVKQNCVSAVVRVEFLGKLGFVGKAGFAGKAVFVIAGMVASVARVGYGETPDLSGKLGFVGICFWERHCLEETMNELYYTS